MWTGYVVGLNVRLKSLVQLSNTDIEKILEKVRLTCVFVSLLHFFLLHSVNLFLLTLFMPVILFNIVLEEQWNTVPGAVPEDYICWRECRKKLNSLRFFVIWSLRSLYVKTEYYYKHYAMFTIVYVENESALHNFLEYIVHLFGLTSFLCSIHTLAARWCWLTNSILRRFSVFVFTDVLEFVILCEYSVAVLKNISIQVKTLVS